MKAESMREHPDYELFKQNDIVSFYHFQLPRWLMEDSRYMSLSLEAKFTYTLLFNRFQLSKHSGWINGKGEVFVIYTRRELSERLNISAKRVSAAMSELKEYALIWEQRRGRGLANHIYLASVKISLDDALQSKGGPHDRPSSAEAGNMAMEKNTREANVKGIEQLNAADANDIDTNVADANAEDPNATDTNTVDTNIAGAKDNDSKNITTHVRTARTAVLDFEPKPASTAQDPPDRSFKNIPNGASKTAGPTVQEPPFPPSSYLDFKDLRDSNQSQSTSSPYTPRMGTGGQTDIGILNAVIERAELEAFEAGDAAVIRDAIERLFYSHSIQAGNAVYPNARIRSHLWRLNAVIVQDALTKLTGNTTARIRNSSAYVASVLFNTIMESGSDLIVDPYLNSLRINRTYRAAVPPGMGGG